MSDFIPPIYKNDHFDPNDFNLPSFIPPGYPKISETMFPLSQKIIILEIGQKLVIGKSPENNPELIGDAANSTTISRTHLTIEKVNAGGETFLKISSGDGERPATNGIYVYEEYAGKQKGEWKRIETPEYQGCVLVKPGTLVALSDPALGFIFRVEDREDSVMLLNFRTVESQK